MTAKQIAFDIEAREKMLRGIQKLARAVRTTLGPSGRVVILEKSFGAPSITKDGVSVAKEIELENKIQIHLLLGIKIQNLLGQTIQYLLINYYKLTVLPKW